MLSFMPERAFFRQRGGGKARMIPLSSPGVAFLEGGADCILGHRGSGVILRSWLLVIIFFVDASLFIF